MEWLNGLMPEHQWITSVFNFLTIATTATTAHPSSTHCGPDTLFILPCCHTNCSHLINGTPEKLHLHILVPTNSKTPLIRPVFDEAISLSKIDGLHSLPHL